MSPETRVDVAVALIVRGKEVLAVWNPKWACFTLPMTKPRVLPSADGDHGKKIEDWYDAAARVVAECCGITCSLDANSPRRLREVLVNYELIQSERDGVPKKYRLQVYEIYFPAGANVPLVPQTIGEWLRPLDFVDLKRRPISPTARQVMQAALDKGAFDLVR